MVVTGYIAIVCCFVSFILAYFAMDPTDEKDNRLLYWVSKILGTFFYGVCISLATFAAVLGITLIFLVSKDIHKEQKEFDVMYYDSYKGEYTYYEKDSTGVKKRTMDEDDVNIIQGPGDSTILIQTYDIIADSVFWDSVRDKDILKWDIVKGKDNRVIELKP